MVTPTTPITQAMTQQTENVSSASDVEMFNRPDTTDVIKKFLLRRLVSGVIRDNEQKNILTDVSIVDLQNNQTILGHNENVPHFAASINKVPITMLVLEELRAEHITLDTQVSWLESDRRAGNGIYDQPGSVLQASVRDVLQDLLKRSGNTAARILVNSTLGGATAVNNRLALVPEIPHTRLIPLDANRFYMGDTTSGEALFVLRKVVSVDDTYSRLVKDFMANSIFDDIGAKSQLAGNDYIVLVSKNGVLDDPDGDNRHDMGIIYNTRTHKSYGYSSLTTSPSGAGVTGAAEQSLKDMGRYDLRFAGDKPHRDIAPQPFSTQKTKPESKILY